MAPALRTAALILVLLLGLVSSPPARAAPPLPPWDVFGTREVRSDDLSMFTKWMNARSKNERETMTPDRMCARNRLCLVEWQKLMDGLSGADRRMQISKVNETMNRSPYIEDIVNWAVSDYWESPFEFMDVSGDCEDYAIAKFFAMLKLGVSNDDMRIAVVRDMNLKVEHAVLLVKADDVIWLLDNQIKTAVRADLIRHYAPYYSLNLTTWWRHMPRQ